MLVPGVLTRHDRTQAELEQQVGTEAVRARQEILKLSRDPQWHFADHGGFGNAAAENRECCVKRREPAKGSWILMK